MEIQIRKVQSEDQEFWMSLDRHGDRAGFKEKVMTGKGYVICQGEKRVGLLHYCVLWDNCPFLNFLVLKESCRRKGWGRKAMESWEGEMKAKGYKMTLVSTQVDEEAQHFYRKLGYVDCGGLVFEGTPLGQPMELVMRKVLSEGSGEEESRAEKAG